MVTPEGRRPRPFAELLQELSDEVKRQVVDERVAGAEVLNYTLGHEAVNVGLAYWCARFLRARELRGDEALRDQLIQRATEYLWTPFRVRDFAEYYNQEIRSFRSWFYAWLRTAWLQAQRDFLREQDQGTEGGGCVGIEAAAELMDPRPGPLAEIFDREAATLLEAVLGQAIASIDDETARAVLHLYVSRSMSQQEIAAAVGRSEGRISQILSTYRPRLRRIVDEWRALDHE